MPTYAHTYICGTLIKTKVLAYNVNLNYVKAVEWVQHFAAAVLALTKEREKTHTHKLILAIPGKHHNNPRKEMASDWLVYTFSFPKIILLHLLQFVTETVCLGDFKWTHSVLTDVKEEVHWF